MDFDKIMKRIKDETGAKTQTEIAEVLGVRQATVSDAKRRGSVPAEWLLKLCRSHNLNPMWLVEGFEPKYITNREPMDEETEQAMVHMAKRLSPSEAIKKHNAEYYHELRFPEILKSIFSLQDDLRIKLPINREMQVIEAFARKEYVDLEFLEKVLCLIDKNLDKFELYPIVKYIVRAEAIVDLYVEFYNKKDKPSNSDASEYIKKELSKLAKSETLDPDIKSKL